MPKAKSKSMGAAVAKPVSKALKVVVWLTGVLVALAVGFGMIGETLTVPWVQPIVPFAGWIVVILTILGIIIAIADAAKK